VRAGGRPPDLWFGPAFVAPPPWRGPSVITIHDLLFRSHPDLYRGRAAAAYVDWAVTRSATAAERIICPSPVIAGRVVETLAVDPERVVSLPWGVGPEFRQARSADAEGYVLFAGRDTERKGLDVLLEAARIARNRGTAIRVRTTYPPRARRDADVEVEVVPAVDDAELARLYAGALVLVYPSLSEGFGFPVAEAMACACPVIASELAEIREWAGDGPLYVAPGDANALAESLVRLSSDSALRARMAARGLELAAGRTWEAFGSRAAAVIEAALADQRVGSGSTSR
jgi:glycosyltransferase involved in cell wall biosynthesis